MRAYYNEIDPKTAEWLRGLIKAGAITEGDVDERSIEDVMPRDLRGHDRCHFFAGIGTWDYALSRAGWGGRAVWTGSCPCQPFSAAGKRAGFADERHLWPAWFHLISQCRPHTIIGEQVSSQDNWLDLVSSDLEGIGYAVGALDIPSAGVGGWDRRQRLYFVADSSGSTGAGVDRILGINARAKGDEKAESAYGGADGELADSERERLDGWNSAPVKKGSLDAFASETAGNDGEAQGFTICPGLEGYSRNERDGHKPGRFGTVAPRPTAETGESLLYTDTEWIYCRDGKYRPVAVVPESELFEGDPETAGDLGYMRVSGALGAVEKTVVFPLIKKRKAGTMRLRGYGNGLNGDLATALVRTVMDVLGE